MILHGIFIGLFVYLIIEHLGEDWYDSLYK